MRPARPLKPLVALYKAYRGGEWFEASLNSVKSQCIGIVVVLSDLPWCDVKGSSHLPGNCREPLDRFQKQHREIPVISIRPSGRQNTEEQYSTGMQLIKSVFGLNVGVLIVDTDEVWEEKDLICLRKAMTENPQALVFRSGIWTYLKSPLYRVSPQERARVVVGLAHPGLPTGKSRFANIGDLFSSDRICDVLECNFHHYAYVRSWGDEIPIKLANSTSQDKVPTVPNWKEKVWDTLPQGTNLHPQIGFEKCWGGVEVIGLDQCPDDAIESDTFWTGIGYGRGDMNRYTDVFLLDSPTWRQELEKTDPKKCPGTTVPERLFSPLLGALSQITGRCFDRDALRFLQSRLRMSFAELGQLASLCSRLPADSLVLEVGSGFGGSMAVMLLSSPNSTNLTAVDPYTPYDEENVNLDRGLREGSVETFVNTIQRTQHLCPPSDRVNLIGLPSREASLKIIPGSLDLLLVDGNHSYANCKEDLDLWWPKVKSGGLMLVHDYAPRFPGVVRAVKEFEAERGLRFSLPSGSTLAWLRKD